MHDVGVHELHRGFPAARDQDLLEDQVQLLGDRDRLVPTFPAGSRHPAEKVVVLEERHKDLGLKDLWGEEISDRLFLTSWRICGEEYVLLEDQGVVRDVLKFPKHSKDSPQFISSCQLNGHDLPGTAIGVLKNEAGVEMLPAVIAWKIDEKQKKFVKLQPEGLRCSRDGITTEP